MLALTKVLRLRRDGLLFSGFIGLAIGAREAERTLGTVNVLTRHFRMVTYPVLALPGACQLRRSEILASGVLGRDLATAMVSSTAAILTMPNPITLKPWTDNLSKVLPQKLDDRGLPEDSSADAAQGSWKLLGLKISAFTELEVAFIKKHKAFPTCSKTGARLLFPTLEAMRLMSVLTTSRSTRTETAEPTRLQRTIIFLMMGGFLSRVIWVEDFLIASQRRSKWGTLIKQRGSTFWRGSRVNQYS